ncbi:MAG: hypothetical protein VR64_12610 [Desulfatitalea sp. BRH_c12]|nr:MAG: hypothetical protein VR64_12610 [Desulfatitalea sp. BRH_c12]
MNPIEELKAEHRGIESALTILTEIADQMGTSTETALVQDAEDLLDFFRTFVDTCHHGKEEQGLFPALERAGVQRQGGPVGVMLGEHEQGRTHIREMGRALQDYQAGMPQADERFRRHADAYRQLLEQHIAKEDQVLFEMAAQRLPQDQQRRLEEQFAQIEREVVGVGRHEQYHAMLDAFTKKYGG